MEKESVTTMFKSEQNTIKFKEFFNLKKWNGKETLGL